MEIKTMGCHDFACVALAAVLVSWLSTGCGLVATDFNDLGGPSTQSDVGIEPGCSAVDLGSDTGVLAQGPMVRRAPSGNAGICTGGTADATYVWRAPSSGCYVLEYWSDAVEHQLSLSADTCSGASLGCWMSYGSSEQFRAEANQTYVIGVSFEPGPVAGQFQLTIAPGCR